MATGQVFVTTYPVCTWEVVNTNAWITFVPGNSHIGSETLEFTVASNVTALARTGVFTVAGSQVQVNQSGSPCFYTLSEANAHYGASTANGQINVTTPVGCTWTVENTNAWITIGSALNNTNSGVVSYTVASNSTALSRSGVLTIAGQAYAVTQDGAACTYTLSATSTNFGPAAASGNVNVTTLVGCTWTVDNTNWLDHDWFSI